MPDTDMSECPRHGLRLRYYRSKARDWEPVVERHRAMVAAADKLLRDYAIQHWPWKFTKLNPYGMELADPVMRSALQETGLTYKDSERWSKAVFYLRSELGRQRASEWQELWSHPGSPINASASLRNTLRTHGIPLKPAEIAFCTRPVSEAHRWGHDWYLYVSEGELMLMVDERMIEDIEGMPEEITRGTWLREWQK